MRERLYTGQPQQTSCSPSVARYGRIFACLYAHHPMFEDLPLCVAGQRTCAELEYALRKYFPSVAPLSRPHLARHRRVWGAPAIFFVLTLSQNWCTETACRRAAELGELSKPMNGPAEPELRPANRPYGPSNAPRGGGGVFMHTPRCLGTSPYVFLGKGHALSSSMLSESVSHQFPPLSRPHLVRHRRAWGAPAIFSADTFFRRFSHVWQGGA